jgi:hypothetical protein
MPLDSATGGDDFLSEEQVLRLLEDSLLPRDQENLKDWLDNGKRLQSSLFEDPLKVPSASSKASMKSTKEPQLAFLLSLSSTLNIDELQAERLLMEYCEQQVLQSRESTTRKLELESFSVLENVRDFYYNQQQYLWKILQELLRIDKEEDHSCCFLAKSNIQHLVNGDLLGTLLHRITQLQNWQPIILSKSQLAAFPGSIAPFALLDTRCSDFMVRHMLASAEFAVNELERALESLILLLYKHASLNQLQLETLMTNASRDSYSVPGGCIQLVKSILGQGDGPFKVPFHVYNKEGLPTVESAYQSLAEKLSMKYIVIFSESLQFWRALQTSENWEERETHPLLENYDHGDTLRFTIHLFNSFDNLPKKSKSEHENVHTVTLFLWALFLEMFGCHKRAENVPRPEDFSSWLYDSNSARNLVPNGSQRDDLLSARSIAELLLAKTLAAGALESFESILHRVIGLPAKSGTGTEFGTGTETGTEGALSALLGTSYASSRDTYTDKKAEGEGVDLLLVCTVLQETVNVIISIVCLADGEIDQLMNVSLLIELTHRGHDDLCEIFWSEWQRKSEGEGSGNRTTYPLCLLVESLLQNTIHVPVYLFSILTTLACSPSKSMIILETLNRQVSMVKWTAAKDLLFLETNSSSGFGYGGTRDSQWLELNDWKRGKSSFIGANVVFNSTSSSSIMRGQGFGGGLKAVQDPVHGSKGVVCDVAGDGRLLVRWEEKILWWGVVLDTIGHSPLAAASISNELTNTLTRISDSPVESIKTSATLNLLSVLMSKQKLLTSFYLESKSEQLLLHSVLIDIGGSHLFNTLSNANETVTKILVDPQRAYERLIGEEVGLHPEEVAELITLLQEYAKSSVLSICVPQQMGEEYTVASSSSVQCALVASVVSVVFTLSKKTGGKINQAEQSNSYKRISDSLLLSALQFLSSFSSTSSRWASTVIKSLAHKFVSHGPSSFAEVMYAITTGGDGDILGGKNSWEVTNEVCYLLYVLLLSTYDNQTKDTEATQQLILPLINYVLTVFVTLEEEKAVGILDRSSFTGWRGRFTQRCLSILQLILSRSVSSSAKSAASQKDRDRGTLAIADMIRDLLLSRLTQDPRLVRTILRIATDISLTAVLSSTSEQLTASPIKTAAKRIFTAKSAPLKRISNSTLPIDFSTAFLSCTHTELLSCMAVTSSAIEVLSLTIDLQARRSPESLPVVMNILVGCVGRSERAPEDCSFLTLLCGLVQSPDRLALGSTGQIELRWKTLNALTDMVLLMSPRSSQPVESTPSLTDSIGASCTNELCLSLCDLLEIGSASSDRRGAVAAMDLLLALGQEQPLTLVTLLNIKKGADGSATGVTSSESCTSPVGGSGGGSEHKVGILLSAVRMLLGHAKILYKSHPLLLHKVYELIVILWRSASTVPPLGIAAVRLIQIEPKFFSLVTVPLTSNLPDAPVVTPTSTAKSANTGSTLSVRTSTEEGIASIHSILTAAIEGADVSQMLTDSKKALRLLEKSTSEYCYTLLTHASSLQIVALERHGHLFSIDTVTARKADAEMRTFFIKATESSRFFSWLKNYMQVDINDNIGEEVAREARKLGVDLSNLVFHGSHVAGSTIGPRTQFGDHYIYDVDVLHQKVVSIFESRCLEIDEDFSPAVVASQLNAWTAMESRVHSLNLQWSLSDAQMVLLQSWKVFIQTFVLPGSSARQKAYKALFELNSRSTGYTEDGWTPPASPAAGSLSPSFDPITGSPSGPSSSAFAGDKRSYELVHEISKHLIAATSPVPGAEESDHPTPVLAAIGVGAARVLLEKTELLTSMLHHQLREVLLRTSDPRNSQVDSRHLGSSRLSPEKMKNLLMNLSKCYTAIMAGLEDHPVSLMHMAKPSKPRNTQRDLQPEQLKRAIQKQLFIVLILTLRGIVQLDSAPLFTDRSGAADDEVSTSSLSAPASLIRLQIFRSAAAVVRQEIEAQQGPDPELGPGSLLVIALRLMKCCLPVNVSNLSLSAAQAWRAETSRPQTHLSLMLTGLLRTLSESCLKENTPVADHDYNSGSWGYSTVCGPGGSPTAPSPTGKRVDPSHSSALFAVLDVIYGGISSGVLPLSQVLGTYHILREFSSLGVMLELQRVLLDQPLSRSAALMGYSSSTGEISDLTNCWERIVDIVSLIVTQSTQGQHVDSAAFLMHLDEERQRELEGVRDVMFEESTSFLQTYGPLLMLPLTQMFVHDRSGTSRFTIRRVQLCRSTVTLLCTMTQQFRVWRTVLPSLFDAAVAEALRAAAVFISILTDVKPEDKGSPHPVSEPEGAEEEKDVVSTPGGNMSKRGLNSTTHTVNRTIYNNIMAVSEGEKVDEPQTSSLKKRRSSISRPRSASRPPTQAESAKKAGLKVHFNEKTYYSEHSGFDSGIGSGSGSRFESSPRHGDMDSVYGAVSSDFVLNMDREFLSSLVSILLFLKEVSPEAGADFTRLDASTVCVGSKIYYYSRAYEHATRQIHLLEGMVVAINEVDGNSARNYRHNVEEKFEVVLANGAREFDVAPEDVIYPCPPMLTYQRLAVPYTACGESSYSSLNDEFPFSTQCGLVVSVAKDLVSRSSLSTEIWTGRGLGVIAHGALAPQKCIEGEESCTTAHLLRILAYATSKVTHTRLSECTTFQSSSGPLGADLEPPQSAKSSSAQSREVEGELETLSGLSSWLCLGALSHHAHAFVPRRCTSSFAYIGGRPGMIEQLEYLKSFVIGDAKVLSPPQWLKSDHWKQYSECLLIASEEVIERLRDRVLSPIATPEAPPVEQKKGTKIGLRTKLLFVATPEEL